MRAKLALLSGPAARRALKSGLRDIKEEACPLRPQGQNKARLPIVLDKQPCLVLEARSVPNEKRKPRKCK